MKPQSIDPIEFLGRIGIYKEGVHFKKVQVVGIRQPDLKYLFFTLQPIGDLVCRREGRQGIFETPTEPVEEFDFGGNVDYMSVSEDSIWLQYIGEVIFETEVIKKFENQENGFWKHFF